MHDTCLIHVGHGIGMSTCYQHECPCLTVINPKCSCLFCDQHETYGNKVDLLHTVLYKIF